MRSYLTNRTQIVRVGDVLSGSLGLTVGVPQGSILGPLLFLIYINNLPECEPAAYFSLFADDASVSLRFQDKKEIADGVCGAQLGVRSWFRRNDLILNESKTHNMVFTLRDNVDLGSAETVRFLGVTLDPKLNWVPHIDELATKLGRNIFLLRNLAASVSPAVLRTAYFALCHSLLSYAIVAWGNSSGAKRVFALQRRAVRIIGGLGYREECRGAFISNKILTLPSLYVLENLLYAKTHLNDFNTNSDFHSYHTRNRNRLTTPFFRLKKCQNGPNFLAIKFFNSLPNRVADLPLSQFKNVLKRFLVGKAFYSCDEFLKSEMSF